MKHILCLLAVIIAGLLFCGCNNTTTETSSTTNEEQCKKDVCPIRLQRLMCKLNDLTRKENIQWRSSISVVNNQTMYSLSMSGGWLTISDGHAWFDISVENHSSVIIDVTNDCSRDLYKYLEETQSIKKAEQRAIEEFTDRAEKENFAKPAENDK